MATHHPSPTTPIGVLVVLTIALKINHGGEFKQISMQELVIEYM